MYVRILIIFTVILAIAGTLFAQDPKAPEPKPEQEGEQKPEQEGEREPPPPPPPPPEPSPKAVSLKQVQIQMWIGETTDKGIRDIGTNLGYTRRDDNGSRGGNNDILEGVVTTTFDPFDPDFIVTLPAPDSNPYPDNLRPDLFGDASDGIQAPVGGGMTFTIIDAGHGIVDGVFRANELNSNVDLISKPELLVRDGQQAEIHAGGQVPFQDVKYKNDKPQLSVQWTNIGVSLRLCPTILSEDLVQIYIIQLDVSDIIRIDNIRGIDLPVFSTRSQTGQVIVPNGQTLVIGGLTSRVERTSESRIPLLGNIPILGMPFRFRKTEVNERQLLIFLSPTIIDLRKMDPQAESAINFWITDKWRNMKRVEQEKVSMQEEP